MMLMVLLQAFSVLWDSIPLTANEHPTGFVTQSESGDSHHGHGESNAESHQCDNCCHCHGSHLSLLSQSMVPGTVTFPPLHNVISIGQPARFPDLIDRPPIA